MPEDSITPAAERFLRPPRLADQPVADRLDLLIELTQTTNRLLAALVEQGSDPRIIINAADVPKKPGPVFSGPLPTPPTEVADPPSAKRARRGAVGSHP